MAHAAGLLTADDLFWMPDDDLWHELVEGRLITMSPPEFAHGICGNRLNVALTAFVKERRLGLVAPQGAGFKPDGERVKRAAPSRGDEVPRFRYNALVTPGSAATRAARIVVRRFASAADADRHDLEFWQSQPDAERILQVWRLSEELWRWRGEYPDEPGLCRSVARVHRA